MGNDISAGCGNATPLQERAIRGELSSAPPKGVSQKYPFLLSSCPRYYNCFSHLGENPAEMSPSALVTLLLVLCSQGISQQRCQLLPLFCSPKGDSQKRFCSMLAKENHHPKPFQEIHCESEIQASGCLY